eukprot:6206856-Pleurochrysis_carterae.AAC.3
MFDLCSQLMLSPLSVDVLSTITTSPLTQPSQNIEESLSFRRAGDAPHRALVNVAACGASNGDGDVRLGQLSPLLSALCGAASMRPVRGAAHRGVASRRPIGCHNACVNRGRRAQQTQGKV